MELEFLPMDPADKLPDGCGLRPRFSERATSIALDNERLLKQRIKSRVIMRYFASQAEYADDEDRYALYRVQADYHEQVIKDCKVAMDTNDGRQMVIRAEAEQINNFCKAAHCLCLMAMEYPEVAQDLLNEYPST